LFFDEADSILGKRMTQVTQAADHGVNVARAVMLKQLDEFDGIVAFATNLARNFDGAFVRRILMHIEIPLPDAARRLLLWQKMITPAVPGRGTIGWQELAEQSDGLSGGDIKNAVVNALAAVAARDDGERFATTADFAQAIEDVRRAARDVGPGRVVTVREEVLDVRP
jgi:ATP-dependent 26S proteasome regulatory subunit